MNDTILAKIRGSGGRDIKLEKIEYGLARGRAAIREAVQNKSYMPNLPDKDYVPIGPVYRNAYAFHRLVICIIYFCGTLFVKQSDGLKSWNVRAVDGMKLNEEN